jgi:GT2 family glycosyltransferase
MSKHHISVGFILTENIKFLESFFKCIEQQTHTPKHIFLYDNTNGTHKEIITKKYPNIEYITGENIGFSKAHNIMIHKTKTPYYFCGNISQIFENNYFEELLKAIELQNYYGSAVGKTYKLTSKGEKTNIIDNLGIQIHEHHQVTHIHSGKYDNGLYDIPAEVFGGSGSSTLFSISILNHIKQNNVYFDENIFAYKEDVDLAYRLQLHGYRTIYTPQAQTWYFRNMEYKEHFHNAKKHHIPKLLSSLHHSYIIEKYITPNIDVWSKKTLHKVHFFAFARLLWYFVFHHKIWKTWKKHISIYKQRAQRERSAIQNIHNIQTIQKCIDHPMVYIFPKLPKKTSVCITLLTQMKSRISIHNYVTKGLQKLLQSEHTSSIHIINIINNTISKKLLHIYNQETQNIKMEKNIQLHNTHIPNVRKIGSYTSYTKGHNFIHNNTKSDIRICMNDDITVDTKTIQTLINYLKKNPSVGLVAPIIKDIHDKEIPTRRHFPTFIMQIANRIPFIKHIFHTQEYYAHDNSHTDWICSHIWAVREDVWQKLNGFDEQFFLYMGDVDFCRRVHQIGYHIEQIDAGKVVSWRSLSSKGSIWSFVTKLSLKIHLIDSLKYFLKWRKNKIQAHTS